MKKIMIVAVVFVLMAVFSAMAESLNLGPNETQKEYGSVKVLRVSNIDIPIQIISGSGKTVKVNSTIPVKLDVRAVNGILVVVGNGPEVGANTSSANSNVYQKSHGDSSVNIAGARSVTIISGNGPKKKKDMKGLTIMIPKGTKIETRNISGDLRISE